MAITISQSTKHFSTFSAALNKAIRKQHANKNTILFYRNHIVIARLEKDFGLDVLIRSSFIYHLDKKDLNNVKYLTFLDSF